MLGIFLALVAEYVTKGVYQILKALLYLGLEYIHLSTIIIAARSGGPMQEPICTLKADTGLLINSIPLYTIVSKLFSYYGHCDF